jgi:uncharacterized membrane protein
MKNFDRVVDVLLLLPAVVWSLIGIMDLVGNGLSSYTSLLPFPFKIHTFTLLPITTFYMTTFVTVKPHKPVSNFSISSSLLFLSNAVYEFVFAILISPYTSPAPPLGGVVITLPLVLGGILLLFFLNRRLHFLKSDRNRALLFLVCFSSFIAVMLVLYYSGFFEQVQLYIMGETANTVSYQDSVLWILSKFLGIWIFFPLLDFSSKLFPKRKRATSSEMNPTTPAKDRFFR